MPLRCGGIYKKCTVANFHRVSVAELLKSVNIKQRYATKIFWHIFTEYNINTYHTKYIISNHNLYSQTDRVTSDNQGKQNDLKHQRNLITSFLDHARSLQKPSQKHMPLMSSLESNYTAVCNCTTVIPFHALCVLPLATAPFQRLLHRSGTVCQSRSIRLRRCKFSAAD